MPLIVRNTFNEFIVGLYKNFTLLLFFILPARVSNIFVSLSILALIFDVRHMDYKHLHMDDDKFNKLLRVTFNEEIMLLPSYTLHWFWKDEFLNHSLTIDEKTITVKQALTDDEILFKHLRYITEILIQNIPSILKFKLNLNNVKEKLMIKHNVMSLLMYA